MSSQLTKYTTAVEDSVPGAVVHLNGGGVRVDLPCSQCGNTVTDAIHAGSRMPPDRIYKMLKVRGWSLGSSGRKHVCPAHRPAANQPEDTPMPEPTPALKVVANSSASAGAMATAATDSARRAKRDAVTWLEESFDVGAGRFKEGVSDATIAAETGLADAVVTALREDLFGPLKEPSELASLRVELDALNETTSILVKNFTAEITGLRSNIEAVTRRIDAMAVKNGWKAA